MQHQRANGTYGGNLVITNNFDYRNANANIAAGFWYVFSSAVSGTAAPGRVERSLHQLILPLPIPTPQYGTTTIQVRPLPVSVAAQ
jgi:hypothetical protein